jgi:hypothetical protein
MVKVGIFYANFEYITAIWYILWPFGNLVTIFPRSGILCQENLATPIWSNAMQCKKDRAHLVTDCRMH